MSVRIYTTSFFFWSASLSMIAQAQGQGMGGGSGGGKGGGGQAEETASEAELFNDASLPGIHGDTGDTGEESSLYRDATLAGGDCALVIATRIDKQSGTAFLWIPNPNVEDNCDMNGIPANRTFNIRQLAPPVADFDGDMVHETDEEVNFARIELAGLYKPVADVMSEGVNINVSIGPYRIAYPKVYPTALDFQDNGTGTFDIRTVTAGTDPAFPASICAWPTGKTRGKTICEPIDGGIHLPIKVRFTRLPPVQ